MSKLETILIKTAHTSNIANVAYENCKILEQFGVPVELFCHDITHIMSQPEWDDLDLDSEDFPDENNFHSHSAELGNYQRPSWYHSGTLFNQSIEEQERTVKFKHQNIKRSIRQITDKTIFLLLPYLRKLPNPIARLLKSIYYRSHVLFFSNDYTYPLVKSRTLSQGISQGISQSIANSKKHGDEWALSKNDCVEYVFHSRWMSFATRDADVIFAYVLSPIYSLLNHNKPYVAVEIGTMRDIPFEGTARGRLLAQAYRAADYVLITNPDVRLQAEKLGLKNYDFCPHPIDEDRYKPLSGNERLQARYELFDVSDQTLVIFAPARQNWRVKGNNKYFRALQRCVQEKMDVKLVIPGWGQEVERSKSYCEELGISEFVKWIRPVSEGGLIKYFSSADIVLDQYELGVFGLITPKALSCGAVVITSYEHSLNDWCFNEHPPLLPASTEHEIYTHLFNLYNDRGLLKSTSDASRSWVIKEHSKHRVMDTLMRAAEKAVKNFSDRMKDEKA